MCLFTLKGKFRTSEDIRTWKVVLLNEKTGEWRGVYNKNDKVFPTNEVVTNRERKEVDLDGWTNIVGGGFFHSSQSWEEIDYIKRMTDFFIEKKPDGFKTAILECVIPKGTECYTNPSRSYASRKIKVIK